MSFNRGEAPWTYAGRRDYCLTGYGPRLRATCEMPERGVGGGDAQTDRPRLGDSLGPLSGDPYSARNSLQGFAEVSSGTPPTTASRRAHPRKRPPDARASEGRKTVKRRLVEHDGVELGLEPDCAVV